MRKIVFISLFVLAPLCRGQIVGPCRAEYTRQLSRIRTAATPDEVTAAVERMVRINNDPHCFAEAAGNLLGRDQAFKTLFKAFESARTDKQQGAAASSNGTTSLVSRGVTSKALGLAAEYGALTESVKGQVVTVSGNLAGFPSVLAAKDLVPFCDQRFGSGQACIQSSTLRFLRKLSFSVSFDTSQNSQTITGTSAPTTGGSTSTSQQPTPVTFQANRHDISSITGRFEIINKRDVTSKEYQQAWQDAIANAKPLKAAGDTLVADIESTVGKLIATTPYRKWQNHARTELNAHSKDGDDQLLDLWAKLVSQLVTDLRAADEEFTQDIRKLLGAFQAYDLAEDDFIDSIAVKPVLTFEYVNNRPIGQTPVSTFRLIGEFGWGKSNNLTFNAAAGVYDSAQPTINGQPSSRWRDVEVGAQYERRLGNLSFLGPAALDFSGYFQNQRSAAVLNVDPTQPLPGITFVGLPSGAKQVFASKGDIGIGQVRLVLGPGGSSVRVPVAVSWSNRTELIDKPTWRAQIGISYDFDSLFKK